jgi:putative ATP-dependent endonuclease of OLD family
VRPNLRDLENAFVKIFACPTTFERELTDIGTIPMFIRAAHALGATGVSRRLAQFRQRWNLDLAVIDNAKDLVLATARRLGKARFAQMASQHARLSTFIPAYIQQAVEWLIRNDTE